MQPPPVQYVTTSDGVRIAYTVSGAGPPIVVISEPTVSHVELEWSQPVLRDMFERLAERTTLVRLDIRGTGLSERVTDYGPDPLYRDIRAVVDALGLTTYMMVGVLIITPAVVNYVSRVPDEVTHLILLDPFLAMTDILSNPQVVALLTAATVDWATATEMIGLNAFGVGRHEAQSLGAYIRECIGPDFYRLVLRTPVYIDATAVAPAVKTPTLVMRHAQHPFVSADIARNVTAAIPGASFITIPGLWADDPATNVTDRSLDWAATKP